VKRVELVGYVLRMEKSSLIRKALCYGHHKERGNQVDPLTRKEKLSKPWHELQWEVQDGAGWCRLVERKSIFPLKALTGHYWERGNQVDPMEHGEEQLTRKARK
jgi:hypothetical protein